VKECAYDEAAWVKSLVAEAERDLVFVFNIAAGAFGGPKPAPSDQEVPALIERISTGLIAAGCTVGFGDPSTGTWSEAEALRGLPVEQLPMAIAKYYKAAKDEAESLTFFIRSEQER
jgi:hypothetical protein